MKKPILIKENNEIKQIQASINDVFNMFGGIIKSIALKRSRFIKNRYKEDIIQDAYLNAIELYHKYDISKKSLFLSYLSISLYNNIPKKASKYYRLQKHQNIDTAEMYYDIDPSLKYIELIASLTEKQLKLVDLKVNGNGVYDIISIMNISKREYYKLLEETKQVLGYEL